MTISLRISVKSVGKAFLKPDRLLSAKEKAELRVLRRHGAFTRTVTRRAMRPGRVLRPAQYPAQLKALIGAGRDPGTGRYTPGEAIVDVKPEPRKHAPHNKSPLYYTRKLRDGIYFVVDYSKMSVVTGAADLPGQQPDKTPEMLEGGGARTDLTGGEWKLIGEKGTASRKARLVNRKRGRVRYKGHSYVERSHAEALDANMPDMYKDSVR